VAQQCDDTTCPRNDTLCRLPNLGKNQVVDLSRIGGGSVDQQNRNSILNGIDAAALTAFQAGRILAQRQRLLASGTNQNVEEVLRNHDWPF
jgi:hypothetical protein